MSEPREMGCKELVEVVTDYLEGRLPPQDVRRFEEHLEECEGCVNYLDQMRQTIRLVGLLREEDVPREAAERLLEAFATWRRSGSG
jgi:anti-sigma factor (TIGR02949 family)